MKITSMFFVGAVALALVGCKDEGGSDGEGGSSGSGSDGGSDGADDQGSQTNASGQDSAGTADAGSDDASFIGDESGGSEGPTGPQPNGGQCTSDDGCESMHCFSIGQLGGVCSECSEDADCDGGTCSFSIGGASMFAVCEDGSLGDGCNSEACMEGLVCAEIIDVGGIIPTTFCSECNTDAECTDDTICSPFLDQSSGFSGYKECAEPGSHENGQLCPIDDGGTGVGEVCTSTFCGVADLMGFAQVGVCGECLVDGDCGPGGTCVQPTFGMTGVTGAVCEGGAGEESDSGGSSSTGE